MTNEITDKIECRYRNKNNDCTLFSVGKCLTGCARQYKINNSKN